MLSSLLNTFVPLILTIYSPTASPLLPNPYSRLIFSSNGFSLRINRTAALYTYSSPCLCEDSFHSTWCIPYISPTVCSLSALRLPLGSALRGLRLSNETVEFIACGRSQTEERKAHFEAELRSRSVVTIVKRSELSLHAPPQFSLFADPRSVSIPLADPDGPPIQTM